MKCHIVPDEASVKVPHLSYEDRHALNRLTAYGRPILEGSSLRCGCFRCGSSFVAGEITAWMPEEDGADTALCPYCGCDAVLYDTKEFPLSTALLSSMYMGWFKSEYQERENVATYVPPFSGYDDYLRQGIAFRLEKSPRYELVGEVELWLMDNISDWDWLVDKGLAELYSDNMVDTGSHAEKEEGSKDEPDEKSKDAGGLLRIVAHVENDESVEYEFIDERGHVISYPLWHEEDRCLLRELLEKHGSHLMGLLVDPLGSKVRLVVDHGEGAATPAVVSSERE